MGARREADVVNLGYVRLGVDRDRCAPGECIG